MKKFINHINLGLLFNGFSIFSYRYDFLSSFLEGVCVGLGLTLILYGMHIKNHNVPRFMNYKKSILNKALGK